MIQIENLSFRYRKKEPLFRNLNLSMKSGSIYGLLGKNGAGKTTLLKILSGLIFPDEGSCTVLDWEAKKRNPDVLAEICFIPEEFHVPGVSTEMFIRLSSGFYPRFSRDKFAQYLETMELKWVSNLSSMSYGQKKKFLIAFGLATDCRLFVLDEPTNGLDIPSKSQFRKLIASALTDDRTFIVSTHQVRDMENLIDPIMILEDGEIVFNRYTYEVSEQLSVTVQPEEPEDALYTEKVLGGYAVIREKTGNEETQIDLELLFNAVIKNKERIQHIFLQEAVK